MNDTSVSLFADFNKIMEGGFRENTIYLIRGLPGSGKTAFCTTLMSEMLARGEGCVYLTTELAPKDFMAHAKHGFGLDFEPHVKTGKLKFIDGCSWKTGKTGPGLLDISDLTSVSHELAALLSEVTSEKRAHFFLFFDSVTSLLLYNPVETVLKFLQMLVARMRETGEPDLPGMFALETGIHDEQIVNMMSFFMDGVFETRALPTDGDIARQFRVLSLKSATHKTAWLPVKIDRAGFGFGDGALREEARSGETLHGAEGGG